MASYNRNPLAEQVRQIKERVTMDDVVAAVGLGPIPRNRKIRSIYNPNDDTPSLHLYAYDYFDYSTGQGGDQIRFVMDYLGVSFHKAVAWLSSGMSMSAHRRPKTRPAPEEQSDLTDLWRRAVSSDPGHWFDQWAEYAWRKWGLSGREMEQYSTVTSEGQLWTPHWNRNWSVVRGIKIRYLSGEKRAIPGSNFRTSLYRPRQPRHTDHAYLVEGESDSWVAAKHTAHDVFALPTGAATWQTHWHSQLPAHVTLIFDDDDAGHAAAERVSVDLKAEGHQVDIVWPPGGRLAEATLQGWEIP